MSLIQNEFAMEGPHSHLNLLIHLPEANHNQRHLSQFFRLYHLEQPFLADASRDKK